MKQNKTRWVTAIFCAIFLLQGGLAGIDEARAGRRQKESSAEENRPAFVSGIVMEAETGQILFEQDPHKQWPPASLTKMMLMLLVMEKVRQKSISLSDPVEVSAHASKIGGSQVYLKQGEVFTLEEMMKAIVIHSANDACEAVAERIAGSIEGFVEMMNLRAKEIGLKNTRYFNVHGLPPEKGQSSDLTTAYDTAILARELVKYPDILRWASTAKTEFRDGKFILQNTNHLIGKFPGADGLKTGSYHEAGFNLAATAQRDGLRLISVTMGSPSNKIRFREAARLLSSGFNNYKMLTVIKPGDAVAQEVRIKGGVMSSIRPVLPRGARVFLKRSEENGVKSEVRLSNSIWAPLKKGQKLGEFVIMRGGRPAASYDLVTDRDVERANMIKRLWDMVF
ncbi:MAG: D-alanyl-D-alanine carboxypeptidase [Deltaproteobacteria bacterium]|nr:D-alanyl-D-alanine carboxypeptidase [Deltaproteobacteria bacterium]